MPRQRAMASAEMPRAPRELSPKRKYTRGTARVELTGQHHRVSIATGNAAHPPASQRKHAPRARPVGVVRQGENPRSPGASDALCHVCKRLPKLGIQQGAALQQPGHPIRLFVIVFADGVVHAIWVCTGMVVVRAVLDIALIQVLVAVLHVKAGVWVKLPL